MVHFMAFVKLGPRVSCARYNKLCSDSAVLAIEKCKLVDRHLQPHR